MRAGKKVPGGKLLRVEFYCNGAVITSAKITGDFFLHPEEGLSHLEDALLGGMRTMQQRLDTAVSEHDLELIGFSVVDIIELVQGAFDAVQS